MPIANGMHDKNTHVGSISISARQSPGETGNLENPV